MKPRVFHLPDAIRDALEAALAKCVPADSDHLTQTEVERLGEVVAQHLMNYTADPELQPFVRQFREAFLSMREGTGNPLISLENLPPTHGRLAMYGLGALIEMQTKTSINGTRREDDYELLPHFDLGGSNIVQFIYCDHPGSVGQPTVFLTADTIIQRMIQRRNHAGEDVETARKNVVDALLAIRLPKYDAEGKPYSIPFITRNPNYQADYPYEEGQAPPEFFITMDSAMLHNQRIRGNQTIYNEFVHVAKQCVRAYGSENTASTKATTLVMWKANTLINNISQTGVLHGRPAVAEGEQQAGRTIETITRSPPIQNEHSIGPKYAPYVLRNNNDTDRQR